MDRGLGHVHVLLEEVLILVETILLYTVGLVMVLRRLEELDDVTVHRPDRRGRAPQSAGHSRTGLQLGLAGQPVQEVEGRHRGGRHQAINLRELLDDRVVLVDKMLEWDIVVSIIVQPSQELGLLRVLRN